MGALVLVEQAIEALYFRDISHPAHNVAIESERFGLRSNGKTAFYLSGSLESISM